MCGIFAYIGGRPVLITLIKGLRRLEVYITILIYNINYYFLTIMICLFFIFIC